MMVPLRERGNVDPLAPAQLVRSGSRVERMLCALGVNSVLAEQVLGDLAEGYEERAACDRVRSARWWYVCEALRSAPHLGWSAIRDGGPRERLRLASCAAGLVLLVSMTVAAVGMRKGPPARLLAGSASSSDGIVVNNVHPVQFPMRVFDAKGRSLNANGIEYRRVSGAVLSITPEGVVSCTRAGDAMVRATVGSISTDVAVRCRPVRVVEANSWITLFAGGPIQDLPFAAIGEDGRPVTELRGALKVRDSTIATLSGSAIRPLKAGETEVVVSIGDQTATIRVVVHEWDIPFKRLRSGQRFVAIPVRLQRGDTLHFPLPVGRYWLKYLPRHVGEAPPTIIADIMCGPGDGMHVYRIPKDEYAIYCALHTDGRVTLGHGLTGADVVEGTLAIERIHER